MICRSVDNFLNYVSDIMRLMHKAKPETLRSSGSITIEEALQHSDISDLISYISDKKTNELSYKGIDALSDEIKSRFNIDIFPSEEIRKFAIEIIETRNIIVHNRGIINKIFINRTKTKYISGNKVDIEFEYTLKCMELLSQIVHYFDLQAADKFKLPTVDNSTVA